MKNILSIIHYSTFGGPHNHNLQLVPRLAKRNFSTTVLIPSDPGNALARFRDAGIDTITMPLHRLRAVLRPATQAAFLLSMPREIGAIRRIIRERKIDLVQINGLPHPHGAFAARAEGLAVVWQIVDGAAPMMLRRLLMPFVTRTADVLMTTGTQIALDHPGADKMGERLVPFFPPVDVSLFRRNSAIRLAAREELGLDSTDIVIGTIGNLYPGKDHHNFIRAAAAVKKKFPHVRFVILGATYHDFKDLTESLWKEAATLGLKVGEDLIQRDAGSRVAELAQALDIFWLTSRPNSEGAPTCLEEALALEIPVIATDVGSIREMIEEGVYGLVVPPRDPQAIADASARLLKDPELRFQMGKRARTAAERRFSAEICADVHARAYEKAIAYHSARRKETRSAPMATASE